MTLIMALTGNKSCFLEHTFFSSVNPKKVERINVKFPEAKLISIKMFYS